MAGIVDRVTSSLSGSRDLMMLFSNPMFVDLQATLAKDVSQSAIPYTLVQSEEPKTSGAPFSSRQKLPDPPEKVNMIVEDAALQAEFRQLSTLNHPKIGELEKFYQTQSAAIVTQRTDAITKAHNASASLSPEQLQCELLNVNRFYDKQQHHLTQRISSSLMLVKCAIPRNVAPPANNRKKAKSRNLCGEAVEIMRTWYEKHVDNPYPTDDEKAWMADQGGVTIAQVKAWFANKRNRSLNTRPKRQKYRMMQQQQMRGVCNRLETDNSSSSATRSDYAHLLEEISDLITIKADPPPNTAAPEEQVMNKNALTNLSALS